MEKPAQWLTTPLEQEGEDSAESLPATGIQVMAETPLVS